MSVAELRDRLIDKIRKTYNQGILEEAYRLLESESGETEIYLLSAGQKEAISEAREQIKNGDFFTDDHANKEIDEWLKKSSGH